MLTHSWPLTRSLLTENSFCSVYRFGIFLIAVVAVVVVAVVVFAAVVVAVVVVIYNIFFNNKIIK